MNPEDIARQGPGQWNPNAHYNAMRPTKWIPQAEGFVEPPPYTRPYNHIDMSQMGDKAPLLLQLLGAIRNLPFMLTQPNNKPLTGTKPQVI